MDDSSVDAAAGGSGGWRRVTFECLLEVTDWTALAAAVSDRVVDLETGEASMMEIESRDAQLELFVHRLLRYTLEHEGERAGFKPRFSSEVQLEPIDHPTG